MNRSAVGVVDAEGRSPVAAHAYPWDVLDGGRAVDAVLELGADTVNLAAAYHSVRAATPSHPSRRVVDAATSALYVPLEEELWRGVALRPGDPQAWAPTDAHPRAQARLQEAGLTVHAWCALTHVDGLPGTRGSCVRTAFGEVIGHALCPSQPDVVAYVEAVTTQVCRTGPDGLLVEACGQLGLDHGAEHDKTAGADWSPRQQALLSLCTCRWCRDGWVDQGLDRADAQRATETVVEASSLPDGPAGPALEPLLRAVVAHRRASALRLRGLVESVAAAHGVSSVTFHASVDDAATTPGSPVLPARPETTASGFVAHCWESGSQDLVRSCRARLGPDTGLGAYVSVLPPAPRGAEQVAEDWAGLLEAGADWLALYHVGLASTARLRTAADALALVRGGLPSTAPLHLVEETP